LDVLGMQSVSQPVTNMMDKTLAFIPNLFAAAIILVIGLFIANLVKKLVLKFLQSVNVDKWFERVNPQSGASTEEESMSLSTVLANVLYVFILIPIIVTALGALNIRSISYPITTVLNIIPNLFVAIVLVTVGYYIAKIVGNMLRNLLRSTGVNNIYSFLGMDETKKPSIDLANVITNIVKVFIILFFTIEALNVLKLD